MIIAVRPVDSSKGAQWQVCLDQQAITFRSEQEARHFVATLEARLQAPHELPHHELPRYEPELRP
ncbi:hypothetical protein [Pseudomonas schmalbachii]|uniref:DUF2188 domain-containing protein n=1 Tax=Pseudomonas schmalbachii TaxID=2816993 RepID=A0ABS3TT04_9PSED|nr:hypothetical protein [Pseudomonas schmalbachii]MBO3276806.1 hypothetical protein [Pseudomonas schmalbachii]